MTENNEIMYFTVNSPLEASMFSSNFSDHKELVKRLKDWALENQFVLVTAKSDKTKVYLRCKLGQQCQIKINDSERKRSRTSIRQQCPFILKIAKSLDGIYTLKRQDESKNEHKHKHMLSVKELQLIAEGRRKIIQNETVKTISTMIDAGNSIPEIKKTVGGREAVTIMSYYMDLYN